MHVHVHVHVLTMLHAHAHVHVHVVHVHVHVHVPCATCTRTRCMHVRLQRCPYLLLAVSLEVSRGVPRGVPTYYQACGGGTMVWDYPEALEVIRSEQAAGCVAAVLCGHAACYSKCRAPSCYPVLLPRPAGADSPETPCYK